MHSSEVEWNGEIMTEYNKLVRDKIPEIIKSKGETPVTRILGKDEYRQKLIKKLTEEVGEFGKENNADELADILEVVYALANDLGVGKNELEDIRANKSAKRGGFNKRIYLIEVK